MIALYSAQTKVNLTASLVPRSSTKSKLGCDSKVFELGNILALELIELNLIIPLHFHNKSLFLIHNFLLQIFADSRLLQNNGELTVFNVMSKWTNLRLMSPRISHGGWWQFALSPVCILNQQVSHQLCAANLSCCLSIVKLMLKVKFSAPKPSADLQRVELREFNCCKQRFRTFHVQQNVMCARRTKPFFKNNQRFVIFQTSPLTFNYIVWLTLK